MTQFHRYASVELCNARHLRELSKVIDLDDCSIEWICQEKIHGANFSFIYDADTISVARRTDIIKPDEKFFHWSTCRDKYQTDIIELYSRICSDNPLTNAIQVFGEYFGGFYPNMLENNATRVQKGVAYIPGNDFMVFDIRVNTTETDYYLSQTEVETHLADLSLKTIPIFARGPYRNMIKVDPVFQSQIYQLYELPAIKSNLAEGFVCKSNQRHLCSDIRPMFKSKNPKFSEIVSTPRKAEATTDLPADIYDYCNKNRFDAVISKIGVDNPVKKIIGIYVSDIVKDYTADNPGPNIRSIKAKLIEHITSEDLVDTWLKDFTTTTPTDIVNT